MTREEAIRLIGWLKCTTNREDDLEAIDMAIEALSAEAVEVVRCKDCKNRARYAECDFLGEDGFCPHGEHREDGEE